MTPDWYAAAEGASPRVYTRFCLARAVLDEGLMEGVLSLQEYRELWALADAGFQAAYVAELRAGASPRTAGPLLLMWRARSLLLRHLATLAKARAARRRAVYDVGRWK